MAYRANHRHTFVFPFLFLVITAWAGPSSAQHNPILTEEALADPHMIHYLGKYYLYGTYLDGSLTAGSDHYDVWISEDRRQWQKVGNIFSKPSTTLWAPDVYYDEASQLFYLYYSVDFDIGVATSPSPTGPFEDQGLLIEQAIDAHMFRDKGNYYLYYAKVEVTDISDIFIQFVESLLFGEPKPKEGIWVQPMASPTQPIGQPMALLQPDSDWERGLLLDVNEGPWMFKHQDVYYLMYSGSETIFYNYGIGYATATHPMGPFTKYEGNPIVGWQWGGWFQSGIYSPGHHSVTTDAQQRHWLIYHQKPSLFHIGLSHRWVSEDKLKIDNDGSLRVEATPLSFQ